MNMSVASLELSAASLLYKGLTIPLFGYLLYKLLDDTEISLIKGKLVELLLGNSNESQTNVASEPLSVTTKIHGGNEKPVFEELQITPSDPTIKWHEKEPMRYRPFKKGEYKMVMGISNLDPSEWLMIENTYKPYTDLKKSEVVDPVLRKHTVYLSEMGIDAMIELYETIVSFLLRRYPQYFSVKGDKLYNSLRDEYIPLDPSTVEVKEDLVAHLGHTIEEDFVVLLQDPEGYNGSEEYCLKAVFFGFAAGFDPLERFGHPLTSLHGPVPDYKSKLKPQMNRFFDKLKPHKFVTRSNWAIQTHNKIFTIGDNKGKEDEEIESLDPDKLDFKREVFFRSERQVLTRLPRTGAMIFTVRQFLVPMSDIRDEGLGEELIGGIELMQEHIGQYKRRPAWGPAVLSYLRGESNGCEKTEIGPICVGRPDF
jgi:hypothetical protein